MKSDIFMATLGVLNLSMFIAVLLQGEAQAAFFAAFGLFGVAKYFVNRRRQ